MGLTVDEVDAYHRHVERRDARLDTSWTLLGVAAGLGVTGALLMYFDNADAEVPLAPRPERASGAPAAALRIAPLLGPHAAAVSLSGQF